MTRLPATVLCALLMAGPASARDISAIKVNPATVALGAVVSIGIELTEGNRCGLQVNFGDGESQELKIEENKGDTVSHLYQKPGNYAVTVQGKTIWRGLNTLAACDANVAAAAVRVKNAPGTAPPALSVEPVDAVTLASSAAPTVAEIRTPSVVLSGGKRMALVIGNDDYQKVRKLAKAGNDATAMARELKSAGFEVLLHRDLNYRSMVKAVETFSNSITGGDQVVVFFAGHGVQVKTGNYLLPVDIEAASESEIEKMSYGLADLTDKLNEARASFALVIVDACRDNPIKSNGRGVGGTRGLSAIEPPKGQMVVFSASKGQQALDSLNDKDANPNGVFTREFIARMKRPGMRIEDMVRDVQDSVEKLALTVSHEQRPALYNEARGNFYFFAPTSAQLAPAALPPVAMDDADTQLWNEVKASGAKEYLDAYLEQYPKGKYAALAKIERKKLEERDRAQRLADSAAKPAVAERDRESALRSDPLAGNVADAANGARVNAAMSERLGAGRLAAMAQAARQKMQRDLAARESQALERLPQGGGR